ncbi:hemolysin family protein [uncultured Bacteroides sp.]|uniref:hemolysin family protein n=1 Tax=uncultured Bacteroides sp. TaxID=162156 RepID=UPI002AAABAF9|nr:hemolysin family protein [uncultured Bacteroides sp.]
MNLLFYILLTLFFSAFFSGIEIAFISADRLRLKMDKNEKSLSFRIHSFFFRHSTDLISTILVGNCFTLVIYGILMADLIKKYLLNGLVENYFLSLFLQIIIATILVLVTGEFIPKTLFKQKANLTLTLFAIPLYLFYVILYPISKISSGLSYIILKLFGVTTNKEVQNKVFGKVDLDYFIQSSIDKADNREEIETEVKIFQNALDFSSIKIRDCIVPRPEIVAVNIDTGVEELKARFIESGISKIIVYQDKIDNIIGYIHSSEMFRNAGNWKTNIQQIPIVPETMGANKLMKLFMQQKKTLAVVVDEFGGTTGIVSLEDLVEEIFGEIEDEHDTTSYIAKQTDDNEYILSARLETEKVNEMFNLEIPESDNYLTIGGFILYHYQNFPKLHEIVNIGHFQFKIIKLTTTKIELVKLKVIE